jgi:hypothetical protein
MACKRSCRSGWRGNTYVRYSSCGQGPSPRWGYGGYPHQDDTVFHTSSRNDGRHLNGPTSARRFV